MLRQLAAALFSIGVAPPAVGDSDKGWTVYSAVEEGREVILRYRASIPSWVKRETMPKLVVITWHLPGTAEMPSRQESENIYEFEDILQAGVERERVGLLFMSTTGRGRVEWQYYAPSLESFMAAMNRSLQGRAKYPVMVEFDSDPTWSSYASITTGK